MPKKKPAAQAREYIQYRQYGKERTPVAAHIDALAELLDRIESEQRNTERWNQVGVELAVDQPHLWSQNEWKQWVEECANKVETCGNWADRSSSAALLRSQAPREPLAGCGGLNEVPIFSLKGLKKVAESILRKAKQHRAADTATTTADTGTKRTPEPGGQQRGTKPKSKADGDEPKLTELELKCLSVLRAEKADSEHRRKKQDVIAAKIMKSATAEYVKKSFQRLGEYGYTEGKRGSAGGNWITTKGKRRLKVEEKSGWKWSE